VCSSSLGTQRAPPRIGPLRHRCAIRGRGFVVWPRDGLDTIGEEPRVSSRKRHRSSPEIGRPCAFVGEALKAIEERGELNTGAKRSERLDPKRDPDRILPPTEARGLVKLPSSARDFCDSDDPSSAAGWVREATTLGVDEEPVPRLECFSLSAPAFADGRPLFGNDPRQRIAVCDREKIVSQRLTLSR
jgi:hypothetical protein